MLAERFVHVRPTISYEKQIHEKKSGERSGKGPGKGERPGKGPGKAREGPGNIYVFIKYVVYVVLIFFVFVNKRCVALLLLSDRLCPPTGPTRGEPEIVGVAGSRTDPPGPQTQPNWWGAEPY